ncbi:MAG: hypothetical protein PHC97_03410 [Patescibacteria group bacterium]|nr:hypothetical protein [Patescibacteria group bacterium]
MFEQKITKLINSKLNSIIWHMIIIGILFFILAAAMLFYPTILLYIFVISFFIISFSAFLIAVKIEHIKKIIDEIELFLPRKK